jgi:hypothetical protein
VLRELDLVESYQLVLENACAELRAFGSEGDEVGQPRRTKRAQRRDDEDGLEQVRLALPVVADEDVEALAWLELYRMQVADLVRDQGLNPQLRSSSA